MENNNQNMPAAAQATAPMMAGSSKPGFDSMEGFELLQRVAKVFNQSTIAPQTFRGPEHFGDAVIAVETAARMHLSPLLVMQNMYIVYGNPAFSSKFLISTFNMCGRYSSIKYKEIGEKGKLSWGCIAYATELATGEIIEGPAVTMQMVSAEGWDEKSGSKWLTMPEQMLRYRAAAFLIRTTAPEILMGFQTTEEAEDIYENQTNDVREEIRVNANSEVFEPKAIEQKKTVEAKVEAPAPAQQKAKAPAKTAKPKAAEKKQAAEEMEEPGF